MLWRWFHKAFTKHSTKHLRSISRSFLQNTHLLLSNLSSLFTLYLRGVHAMWCCHGACAVLMLCGDAVVMLCGAVWCCHVALWCCHSAVWCCPDDVVVLHDVVRGTYWLPLSLRSPYTKRSENNTKRNRLSLSRHLRVSTPWRICW
jgi:hypothetical protein